MTIFKRLFTLLFVLAVAGCIPQAPIRVYVTPTPAGADAVLPATAQVLAVPTDPVPSPTYIGAIVGPDYTPPAPTATPTVPPVVMTFTPVPATPPPVGSPPPALPTLPTLDAQLIGIQIDATQPYDALVYALDRAGQLGVTWIKLQLPWSVFQAEGARTYGDAMIQLDQRFVQEARRRGFRILLSIAKAPAWSRANAAGDGPPDDPQVLADYLTFLMTGAGADWRLFDAINAVEIWNEPNLLREWQGQPLTGASYMRYFDAAYRAIRAINPSLPIITAGLAPTSDSDVSRDDRVYLQEMYDAGLGNYQDVHIGVHPFGWGNPPDARCCALDDARGWDDNPHFFFLETLDAYRDIMNDAGHSGVQMWVTELGWATWDGLPGAAPDVWMTYTDRWAQAQYTLRALEILQRERSDIGLTILWNLNFAPEAAITARDERAAYSLLPAGYPIRPLFWMVTDILNPAYTITDYDRGP